MLEKKIQDILDRMPKIADIPHVFYSSAADEVTGGVGTARLKDEFGGTVKINFVGGCSLDGKGNIIPSLDEEPLEAEPNTYRYIGYIDEENGTVILSDHSPEIPKFDVEV